MNPTAILCSFGVTILCTGCAAGKVATFGKPFADVTNKVAQMQHAVGPHGKARIKWSREEVPGARFRQGMIESGGDPKFSAVTVVTVTRVDDSRTIVELATTKYVLFSLLGERHLFFTERRRWKELNQLLQQ
jgi:hypothetical protein